jgi:hypothetical protein
MLELLIAVSAAAFGAVLAIIAFVAWAVRREDARLSMAEDAPGPMTRAVRRLLGLHVMGIAGPARPAYHTGRRTGRAADWPAHGRDRESRPAYWNDPSGDWPGHGTYGYQDRPAYRIDPPDDWPPDPARARRDATLPAGPRS